MSEIMSSHIDEWPSLKDSPEYQEKLNERVEKIEQDEKSYKHLVKINNLLNKLDLPDEQEEQTRPKLNTLSNEKLQELTTKTRWEIFEILSNIRANDLDVDTNKILKQQQNLNEQYQVNNEKYQKLKNILPEWIYSWNPKFWNIATNLKAFEEANSNEKKLEAIQAIIDKLKNDDELLKTIINKLWWASKNNPKYIEFRNALIDLDPSFESYLPFSETTNKSTSLDTIQAIKWDSWEITNIDLTSNPPVSKLSLIWSEYNFTKEIDTQAVEEVQESFIKELDVFKNSEAILQGLYKPFDYLRNKVRENWWKQDLKTILKNAISTVSKEIFSKLEDAYKTMDIKSDIQITESDLYSFSNIDTLSDLKLKKDKIDDKLEKIETKVWEKEQSIKSNRKTQMEELALLDSATNEKQVKVLKFMNNCGFDKLPKNITNRVIKEIESGTLTIPWLEMSIKNIDLKNGHFGESGAFIDKEAWINIGSKINMVKFMNKLISWNVNEPMSVDTIANGVSVIDPLKLQNQFLEAGVVGGMGWNYGKIIENLRKNK